jgi:5-methylcytosine-specific restriction endonuclease McrA
MSRPKSGNSPLVRKHRDRARVEQDNLCYHCHCPMEDPETLSELSCTAEHLVPRCAGGKNDRTNIVAACRRCNEIKADSLSFRPKGPKVKHERNRRRDEHVVELEQRKMAERQNMWRASCPVR